jgi:GT2 family glycosyltransferase
MKATVIIPNLNGKGWLKDSIESIFAQTEQDFELIVIDNGSTDESLAIARQYQARPNYTLIENGENTGFSHAVNQGIRAAKGEYAVLFNNDAFAEPDWLAQLIAAAEAHPKVFAVQSLMIRHFTRELADDAGDYVNILGFAAKTGDGRSAARYTKTKPIFSACGGAALYRKRILDEIGLFDENFFAYFEDVDISWRAQNAGYSCLLCPAAKCYHICGATTGAVKYNGFKSVQSGRNSILLPWKNQPILMLILNFIPMGLGYALKAYKFHKQGFGKEWDQGYREALALMKAHKVQKRPFRWRDLPHYIKIEFWLIGNLFPYLWYRLVVVRFDLK